jgi:hypothetical protein
MSVREQLVKSLSMILRLSKATMQVLLADANGLSIAKISRSTDIEMDAQAINSVSAATYNFAEEIWKDLGIQHQQIALAFFEKFVIITIRIEPTILTIAHDFNAEWPINAEEIAKIIYQLKIDVDEMFGGAKVDTAMFAATIRNILLLFNMGAEIPLMNYMPERGTSSPEMHDQIATILDSVQNPVFARYSIVSQDGLMLDGRDFMQNSASPISSFSASTLVAFQKLVEESSNLNAGALLSYLCISGPDAQNLYVSSASICGNMIFRDPNSSREITSELTLVTLFALTYGMVPVLCEIRNIVYSITQLLGIQEGPPIDFIKSINNLIKVQYQ